MRNSKHSYTIGFILSSLLTLLEYFIAINKDNNKYAFLQIILLCFLQIIVQMVYFMHITYKNKNETRLSIILTILLIGIILGGSIWIMNNMNKNMRNF